MGANLLSLRIGCAGWSVPRQAKFFPSEGTHLERYAKVFSAVEINSTFYSLPRSSTLRRWFESVPADFRFSVKIPKEITHVHKLKEWPELTPFLKVVANLGTKLGPMLVQLPPSLAFEDHLARKFFAALRRKLGSSIVCEARHVSWLSARADALLTRYKIARVATDPFMSPQGLEPGGWKGLVYIRLHGSPRIYYSSYSQRFLKKLRQRINVWRETAEVWCVFDNTVLSAAQQNAYDLLRSNPTRRA